MHERIKEHDRDIRLASTQTSAISEHANKSSKGSVCSSLSLLWLKHFPYFCCSQQIKEKGKKDLKKEMEMQKKREREEQKRKKEEEKRREREEREEKRRKEEEKKKRERDAKELRKKHKV